MKHQEEYRDPDISRKLIKRINDISKKPVRLMEVCGTHTMSIFRHGIRSVLPDNITLLSGPGCPVCVTSQKDIDAFIELSKEEDTIVVTFGDLMRVPGSMSSLQKEHAMGRDIRMVYSPSDAVKLAEDNPDKKIVFLQLKDSGIVGPMYQDSGLNNQDCHHYHHPCLSYQVSHHYHCPRH